MMMSPVWMPVIVDAVPRMSAVNSMCTMCFMTVCSFPCVFRLLAASSAPDVPAGTCEQCGMSHQQAVML